MRLWPVLQTHHWGAAFPPPSVWLVLGADSGVLSLQGALQHCDAWNMIFTSVFATATSSLNAKFQQHTSGDVQRLPSHLNSCSSLCIWMLPNESKRLLKHFLQQKATAANDLFCFSVGFTVHTPTRSAELVGEAQHVRPHVTCSGFALRHVCLLSCKTESCVHTAGVESLQI